MKWETELERFLTQSKDEQWQWLAKLLFALTMLARGTYAVGGDDLDQPKQMRRFNELIHRTAGQLRHLAIKSPGMPNDVFVKLLAEEVVGLGLNGDELAKLLR